MALSPSDQPPTIPGIDSAELLDRVGDDLDLFWEVLGEFSETYRETPAQLATALIQDTGTARQIAHTLKGVLGNLAATDLYTTCAALHEALRENQTERYPELLVTLSQGLPALCDAIELARTDLPAGPPNPRAEANPAWLRERYAALGVALTGHRARECKALTDEIGTTELHAAERAFFAQLQTLVRAYRFPEAQALLAQHRDA